MDKDLPEPIDAWEETGEAEKIGRGSILRKSLKSIRFYLFEYFFLPEIIFTKRFYLLYHDWTFIDRVTDVFLDLTFFSDK
jgi:hypothetical protein